MKICLTWSPCLQLSKALRTDFLESRGHQGDYLFHWSFMKKVSSLSLSIEDLFFHRRLNLFSSTSIHSISCYPFASITALQYTQLVSVLSPNSALSLPTSPRAHLFSFPPRTLSDFPLPCNKRQNQSLSSRSDNSPRWNTAARQVS